MGDEHARVAIQITSTSGLEKVKETLRKFLSHGLDKDYDRVIIYILTEKQKSYSSISLEEILQGRFSFDVEKDILDYTDILHEVSFFEIHKAKKLVEILDNNFSLSSSERTSSPSLSIQTFSETVHLNLLELFFPETLYIAELTLDEPSNRDIDRKRGRGRKC